MVGSPFLQPLYSAPLAVQMLMDFTAHSMFGENRNQLHQADITGKPRIIDGDTLEIAGERIRLHGIDAPESEQTCVADGKRWHCGMEAASALAFKIARGWVGCQGEDRDRYGRVIAVCYAGGVGGPELNAWLVSEGWALAYRKFSTDYVALTRKNRVHGSISAASVVELNLPRRNYIALSNGTTAPAALEKCLCNMSPLI